MKIRLIFLLLIPLSFSCKKDELKGETLIFEGKWKWTHSWIVYNTGTPNSSYEIKSSDSLGIPDDYYLEFDHKGKVKFYVNDNVVNKYRIVFHRFEESTYSTTSNLFFFDIYLNNDSENNLSGSIRQDTIWVHDSNIPLMDQVSLGSSIHYTHRYIKIN